MSDPTYLPGNPTTVNQILAITIFSSISYAYKAITFLISSHNFFMFDITTNGFWYLVLYDLVVWLVDPPPPAFF